MKAVLGDIAGVFILTLYEKKNIASAAKSKEPFGKGPGFFATTSCIRLQIDYQVPDLNYLVVLLAYLVN